MQIEVLELEIQNLRNDKPFTNTTSVYLEETNARLQKQLMEVRADEQDLAQKVKELSLENRRLKKRKEKP